MVQVSPYKRLITSLKAKITEPSIFLIVMVLNMLPVLLFQFFPTMDGPAHLYNSRLINELIFNPASSISEYFMLNVEPVPNWLSHFLLAAANLVLPAWLAEKFLLIIYFALLPLSFRALIKVYNGPYLSYLIFPFTYSFLFYIGFYNFSLSFIVLFYTIRYWLINNKQNSFKFLSVLLLLITLCYFSHVLVFSFLLFSLFILISQKFIQQLYVGGFSKKLLHLYLKKYLAILLASIPSLYLFVRFFFSREFIAGDNYLDSSELIKWIKDIRPIIALVYNPELRLTEILYHLFIGLTAILFYQRLQNIKYPENISTSKKIIFVLRNGLIVNTDIFLFIALSILIFYFNMPNNGGAGMMSDRFALLFYIFYITWLGIQIFPRWLSIFSMVIIIGINLGFVYRYILATKELNSYVSPIYNTAKYIKPYSTVIPINYSSHWLSPHFSNYLGGNKPLVILENYEADVGWFPIVWNNEMPNITFGNLDKENTGFYWRNSQNKKRNQMADYIFIYGKKNVQEEHIGEIEDVLNRYYTQIIIPESFDIKLYRKKN